MRRTVGLRLLGLIPVLFLLTLGATALTDLLPGSPAVAILGEHATPEQVAQLNAEYGLDRSLPARYGSWISDAFTGDLGRSIRTQQPVADAIAQKLPVTLELAVLAVVLALVIGIPLGLFTAARAGGFTDRVLTGVSSGLMSFPTFVSALILVYLLALRTRVFPVTGWVPLEDGLGANLRHAFLPALTLAILEIPVFHRILRADAVATLQEDFVLSARSKGLSATYVMLRHVLRPSSFSLITLSGISFGRLLGGTVIVESLFALPGLGNLAAQSVNARDIPMLQGIVVFVAVMYALINLLVDVTYTAVDPRVRTG